MSRFKVEYKSGATEEYEQSDSRTLAQFINAKFGSVDPDKHGIKVALIGLPSEEPESNAEVAEINLGTIQLSVDESNTVAEALDSLPTLVAAIKKQSKK